MSASLVLLLLSGQKGQPGDWIKISKLSHRKPESPADPGAFRLAHPARQRVFNVGFRVICEPGDSCKRIRYQVYDVTFCEVEIDVSTL